MLSRAKKLYFGLRPLISAGWIISPIHLFFTWQLLRNNPEDDESVFAKYPLVTAGALLAVTHVFYINFLGKYHNMIRPKKITPTQKWTPDARWKYIPYGLAAANTYIGYPAYILFNGSLCINGYWCVFSSTSLTSRSFWKMLGLIIGGLFLSIPSVYNNYRYNSDRTLNYYLPTFLNGSLFQDKVGKIALAVTVSSLYFGFPLSLAALKGTAQVFTDSELAIDLLSYGCSSAIAINNLFMTVPALTRLLNRRTFSDLENYELAAPHFKKFRAAIMLSCIVDSTLNGLGTTSTFAESHQITSPNQLTPGLGILSAMAGLTIQACVLSTDREMIYVEIQMRQLLLKNAGILFEDLKNLFNKNDSIAQTIINYLDDYPEFSPPKNIPLLDDVKVEQPYTNGNRHLTFAPPKKDESREPLLETENNKPSRCCMPCTIL